MGGLGHGRFLCVHAAPSQSGPPPLARATECSISRLHVVRMRGGVTT